MMQLVIASITTLLVTLATILYIYKKLKWNYWRRKGLETYEPKAFMELGNQFFEAYFYFKNKGLKHGGTYLFFHPYYIAVDLNIIKTITIGSFDNFINRGMFEYRDEKDYLNAHLFNLEDQHWRTSRNKLSPTFTSGKIKMMFQTLVDTSGGLEAILKDYCESGESFEMKDVMARYTTDVILSVAFGIEAHTLKNPDSEFRSLGKLIMRDLDVTTVFLFLFAKMAKPFRAAYFKLFRKRMMKGKIEVEHVKNFFKEALLNTIDYREKNNVHRNDFLHLLLLLKNRGKLDEEGHVSIKGEKGAVGNLTLNELIAQCFLFFIGGFDTSSTSLTFTLFELTKYPEIQEKLRDEIHSHLAENDGKLSYDLIMKMDYLDRVINESLRLNPPVKFLARTCKRDFQIPDTEFTLEKNRMAIIPVKAIHMDPDLYPEPEKFDPDRFSPEQKSTMHPLQHIPFGEGPRMCIGSRFALVQMKVGLICILNKFRVKLNEKTKLPLDMDKSFLSVAVKSGIWFNIEEI